MKRFLMVAIVVTYWVAASPAQSQTTTIVDKLTALGNFTILLAEMKKTGLSERLKGDGPFTLFAPTDHAYRVAREGYQLAVLGIQRVEPLPEEPSALLRVLLRHIMPEKIMAYQLMEHLEDESLAGVTVSYDIEGDIAKLLGRPSVAVRRLDDMFMVNLGPYHTPEGEKAFDANQYKANLISTDIEASNGVIHIIDAVLLRHFGED